MTNHKPDHLEHPDAVQINQGVSIPTGLTTSAYGHIHSTPVHEIEKLYEDMESALKKHDPHTNALEEIIGQHRKVIDTLNKEKGDTDPEEFIAWLIRESLVPGISGPESVAYTKQLEDDYGHVIDDVAKHLTGKNREEVCLKDILDSFENSLQAREDMKDNETYIGSDGLGEVLAFFATTVSLFENRTTHLMHSIFIKDNSKDKDESWEIISGNQGLSESQREKWLLVNDVINSGLYGNLKRVRNRRNEIVHSGKSLAKVDASPDQIRKDGKKGLNAARKLTKIMERELGFSDEN